MAYAKIYVPDRMLSMKLVQLPENTSEVEFGSKWLRDKTDLMLKVPSVVLPYESDIEFNLILNPLHEEFSKIFVAEAHDFSFDFRLLYAD